MPENIPKGIAEWTRRLVDDLEANKRVVVVMGSKKRGLQLKEKVLKPRFVEVANRVRAAIVLQRFWRWRMWRTKLRKPSIRAARDADARKAALLVIGRFVSYIQQAKWNHTRVSVDGFRDYARRTSTSDSSQTIFFFSVPLYTLELSYVFTLSYNHTTHHHSSYQLPL